MDKKKLNNEIVLCRPAVRKARVVVIRKILKKMKILKSCKNESLKEKKLKKAERLFKKIQIMKKVKDDDVTKFALQHSDLDKFLKDTSKGLKDNALASLCKHDAVVKKINAIRDLIPDWETELPLLLQSIGKKKLKKKNKVEKKDENDEQKKEKNKKNDIKVNGEISSKITVKSDGGSPKKVKSEKAVNKKVKISKKMKNPEKKVEEEKDGSSEEQSDVDIGNGDIEDYAYSEGETESGDVEDDDSDVGSSDIDSGKKISNIEKERKNQKRPKEDEDEDEGNDSSDADETKPVVTQKVDDPFFIEKKVIVPKLLLETLNEEKDRPKTKFQDEEYTPPYKFQRDRRSSKPNFRKDEDHSVFQREPFRHKKFSSFVTNDSKKSQKKEENLMFQREPFRYKKDSGLNDLKKPSTEELHPSWAAKKAANLLIKPFQGKKIKFDEE